VYQIIEQLRVYEVAEFTLAKTIDKKVT